jgi:hypothetical protein
MVEPANEALDVTARATQTAHGRASCFLLDNAEFGKCGQTEPTLMQVEFGKGTWAPNKGIRARRIVEDSTRVRRDDATPP